MKKISVGAILALLLFGATLAAAQKDKDNEPTTWVYFTVVKEDNGKPVRNAAVVMHPVNEKGKQERGGLELKTDPEGKANFRFTKTMPAARKKRTPNRRIRRPTRRSPINQNTHQQPG